MSKPKSKLVAVPTLDDCANELDAHELSDLPSDMLERLAERIGVAKARIDVALMIGSRNGRSSEPAMLTPEQAGRLCGRSAGWVRRMARQRNWPFAHRVSRKLLLIDQAGLTAWLASRRA